MGFFDFLKKDKTPKRAAIVDVGDDNFKEQVLRRSHKSVVLVDFWAAWCGPCRQLGPILERLAEEPDGEFILAKLNTEHHQRTAARYQVRSIPNVKAFRNGQVVDEFTGVLPETLVRRFIEKVTAVEPPPSRVKGSSKPARRLQQVEQHLQKGRGFQAFVLIDTFPESEEKAQAEALRPLARFLFDMGDGDALTGLDDLDAAYEAAEKSLRNRQPAKALGHLLTALEIGEEIDRTYTTAVIDAMVALFGKDSPVVQEHHTHPYFT